MGIKYLFSLLMMMVVFLKHLLSSRHCTKRWMDTSKSSWTQSLLESSDGDGAWCPAEPVFPAEAEYLQVDLRRLHLVALVGTQGRHAGGLGKEFSPGYRLRYSRDGHRWMSWKDRWGQEVISGNEDPGGVVLKDLGPPLVARLVRFYPRADRLMSVCLRVELYGCLWKDGLLSYTAPEGQTMYLSEAIHLNDSTYDGYSVSGLQYGGLGQLTDGVLGLDDFRRSRELRVWPGYDYVGWANASFPHGYVEMEFEFDRLRAFRAMQVHCNNMHRQGVRLPGGVDCRFKRGLASGWEEEAVRHTLAGGLGDPSARAVAVPLGGRVARFLQCRFFFAGPWLLFSEIAFLSDIVNGSSLVESSPPSDGSAPPAPGPAPTNFSNLEAEPRGQQPVPKAEGSPTAILIGCLVAIILLLLLVIALMLWRQHWRRLLGKVGIPRALWTAPPTRSPGPAAAARLPGPAPPTVVHLCEVESPQDLLNLEFPLNILRSDATKNARNDFLKEVKIMSRLKDPNIIRLLGVCVQDDPLCMITDYMENGDLNQFLSAHQLEDKAVAGGPGPGGAAQGPTISYPMLLHVAAQIASGMRYLATLNFVHRDLATRNCLVGEHFTIKIADFGMSRNLYAGDYYRVQGRAVLPIRWMAWECILMGKFTTASDVWAFGVTLWEVLTLCRAQPFGQLTDEQVIENAGEFFRDQGRQVYLSRPPTCPLALYELILRCWSREPEERPLFPQLHRCLAEDALNMV
uniref:Epithelial discoidin domain-containing receptor 1 n=1 Tax=Ornithorhynchus anatinus TaxID=9258 RepID=A0A6I8PB31_ORNAN